MPVAGNCCVVPAATATDCGLIVIDTSCAAETINVVEPVIFPDEALMFAVPCNMLVASPVLLIVAVERSSEAHVAVEVRSNVEPSVKVPIAVNCWVVPSAIVGFAGFTAMETRDAAVTVRVVLPLIAPEVAVIVAVPVALLVARPILFPSLLMVATSGVSLDHCTVCVTSCVLPSVNVPVAAN